MLSMNPLAGHMITIRSDGGTNVTVATHEGEIWSIRPGESVGFTSVSADPLHPKYDTRWEMVRK